MGPQPATRCAWLLALMVLGPSAIAESVDWSGYVSLEPRIFLEPPLFPEQNGARLSPSAVLAPELRFEWAQGTHRFTLSPYLRLDSHDSERTHADLREAVWLYGKGPWTVQVGISKVFWGVAESRHLVDIVNQTDQVEDLDQEDKLGQPMISIERWSSVGAFGVFLLPGFRERTFPADDARLRGALPIDSDRAEYESGAKDRRLDWAFRWSHTIDNWDLGLSGFDGTSREPRLLPGLDAANRLVLVPRYDLIGQLGLDVQYTKDAWLWKLEAIRRQGHGKTFGAWVTGVEYTFFNLRQSGADLGFLAEYLRDGRDATAPPTLYDDDWFVGLRLAFNDTQDTAILAGAVVETHGTLAIVEAERRLGEGWKVELEARLFLRIDASDPLLGGLRDDSFITFRFARFL